jgi:CRP-like cAMP-binding protein
MSPIKDGKTARQLLVGSRYPDREMKDRTDIYQSDSQRLMAHGRFLQDTLGGQCANQSSFLRKGGSMSTSNTISLFRNADNYQEFRAGETIFEAGDQGDVMYTVIEGELEVLLNGKLIETCGPGGIVGEMAIIDSRPRSATVKARTDCKLVSIDEKRFTFLVQQTPFFAIQVMRVTVDRLRRHLDHEHG